MNTIKTFIPSYAVDSFEKFAKKTKKFVPEFDYKIGKPDRFDGCRKFEDIEWLN